MLRGKRHWVRRHIWLWLGAIAALTIMTSNPQAAALDALPAQWLLDAACTLGSDCAASCSAILGLGWMSAVGQKLLAFRSSHRDILSNPTTELLSVEINNQGFDRAHAPVHMTVQFTDSKEPVDPILRHESDPAHLADLLAAHRNRHSPPDNATLDHNRWPLVVNLQSVMGDKIDPQMELGLYLLPQTKRHSADEYHSLAIMFNSYQEPVYDNGHVYRWLDKELLTAQLSVWSAEHQALYGIPLEIEFTRLGQSSIFSHGEPHVTRSGALTVIVAGDDRIAVRANIFVLRRMGEWLREQALSGHPKFAHSLMSKSIH